MKVARGAGSAGGTPDPSGGSAGTAGGSAAEDSGVDAALRAHGSAGAERCPCTAAPSATTTRSEAGPGIAGAGGCETRAWIGCVEVICSVMPFTVRDEGEDHLSHCYEQPVQALMLL